MVTSEIPDLNRAGRVPTASIRETVGKARINLRSGAGHLGHWNAERVKDKRLQTRGAPTLIGVKVPGVRIGGAGSKRPARGQQHQRQNRMDV